MKKVICVLTVFALIMSFLAGCNSEKEQISVYFKDGQTNNIREEKRTIKADKDTSSESLAKIAVEELIKGPTEENHKSVISKEARLRSLKVNGKVATVNMSSHYNDKKDTEALLLRFALVSTLCAIEGIDGVVILVEGAPVVSEITGKELGVLSMNDIALNMQNAQTMQEMTIKLYFPKKDGSFLQKEKRKVQIQNALSLEKTVVSEIIKGPESKELSASVAPGTKLLGIETKDNVCFVNFSGEFISKANSGSLETTLSLYSIVNSLCELDGVDSVQILVNGEAGMEFGNFVLDIPYEANKGIVK